MMNTTSEMKKLKRSANFTKPEVELLTKVAKKHYNIIENKKTGSATWNEKKETWEKIAEEFNAQTLFQRDSMCLKKKWDNLKKNVKDKVAGQRQYAMGTGGGPPLPPVDLTQDEQEMLSLIKVQALGLPSEYDSDVVATTKDSLLLEDPTEEYLEEDIFEEDDKPGTSKMPTTWEKYTPAKLQSKKSSVLQIKNLVQEKENEAQIWETHIADTPASTDQSKPSKRLFTGSVTNKVWTQLGEKKKDLAALKMEKIKVEIEVQNLIKQHLILQNKEMELKIKLLQHEVNRVESNN